MPQGDEEQAPEGDEEQAPEGDEEQAPEGNEEHCYLRHRKHVCLARTERARIQDPDPKRACPRLWGSLSLGYF